MLRIATTKSLLGIYKEALMHATTDIQHNASTHTTSGTHDAIQSAPIEGTTTNTYTRITKDSPKYKRSLVALFIGSLVAFGTEYCVQPVIPVIGAEFGLSPTAASLAVTVGLSGMAFAMILIAMWSYRLHRKKTMVYGLSGALALALGIAVSIQFEWILIMRLMQGMLLAGFPAMAITYIQEEFDPRIIATTVGVYVSGSSVGGLLGRFVLSALTDHLGWRYALMVLVALYGMAVLALVYLLPRPQHPLIKNSVRTSPIASIREVVRNRNVLKACTLAAFIMGSCVCTYNFLSFVFLGAPYHWTQLEVGFLYSLYLVGTVSSTLMGRYADESSNKCAFTVSVLCMMAGMIISLAMPSVVKVLGIALYTFGFFGAHSTACSWSGKLDIGDNKATISALYMLFFYIGASLFGTVGGLFLTSFSWAGIVGFNCVLALVALIIGKTIHQIP